MVVVLAFIVCLVMRQHKKSALKKSRHNCSSSMDSGISQRKYVLYYDVSLHMFSRCPLIIVQT